METKDALNILGLPDDFSIPRDPVDSPAVKKAIREARQAFLSKAKKLYHQYEAAASPQKKLKYAKKFQQIYDALHQLCIREKKGFDRSPHRIAYTENELTYINYFANVKGIKLDNRNVPNDIDQHLEHYEAEFANLSLNNTNNHIFSLVINPGHTKIASSANSLSPPVVDFLNKLTDQKTPYPSDKKPVALMQQLTRGTKAAKSGWVFFGVAAKKYADQLSQDSSKNYHTKNQAVKDMSDAAWVLHRWPLCFPKVYDAETFEAFKRYRNIIMLTLYPGVSTHAPFFTTMKTLGELIVNKFEAAQALGGLNGYIRLAEHTMATTEQFRLLKIITAINQGNGVSSPEDIQIYTPDQIRDMENGPQKKNRT